MSHSRHTRRTFFSNSNSSRPRGIPRERTFSGSRVLEVRARFQSATCGCDGRKRRPVSNKTRNRADCQSPGFVIGIPRRSARSRNDSQRWNLAETEPPEVSAVTHEHVRMERCRDGPAGSVRRDARTRADGSVQRRNRHAFDLVLCPISMANTRLL